MFTLINLNFLTVFWLHTFREIHLNRNWYNRLFAGHFSQLQIFFFFFFQRKSLFLLLGAFFCDCFLQRGLQLFSMQLKLKSGWRWNKVLEGWIPICLSTLSSRIHAYRSISVGEMCVLCEARKGQECAFLTRSVHFDFTELSCHHSVCWGPVTSLGASQHSVKTLGGNSGAEMTPGCFRKVVCPGWWVPILRDRLTELSQYLVHTGQGVPPGSCSWLGLACRAESGWGLALVVVGG